MLWAFIGQVLDPDHSCNRALARIQAHRASLGLRALSADTGGYCKARQRLPEALPARLCLRSGAELALFGRRGVDSVVRLHQRRKTDFQRGLSWAGPSARQRRTLLLDLVAHQVVPLRPNRTEPRVRKRRPKNYRLMTKPRSQLIALLTG